MSMICRLGKVRTDRSDIVALHAKFLQRTDAVGFSNATARDTPVTKLTLCPVVLHLLVQLFASSSTRSLISATIKSSFQIRLSQADARRLRLHNQNKHGVSLPLFNLGSYEAPLAQISNRARLPRRHHAQKRVIPPYAAIRGHAGERL